MNEPFQPIALVGCFSKSTHVLFFNTFLSDIDILEEFAFIESPDGGGVTLDVLSTSTKAIAQ